MFFFNLVRLVYVFKKFGTFGLYFRFGGIEVLDFKKIFVVATTLLQRNPERIPSW
jgi:hypothetical protein